MKETGYHTETSRLRHHCFKPNTQGVALGGAFFLRGTGRFFCVHVFGSGAMLPHLVPERIPLRKLRNNMF